MSEKDTIINNIVRKKRKELIVNILLVCFLACIAIYLINNYSNYIFGTPFPELREGINISETSGLPEPVQRDIRNNKVFHETVRGKDIKFTKMCSYDLVGRVVTIKDYNLPIFAYLFPAFNYRERIDYISPKDFGVAWGKLASNDYFGRMKDNSGAAPQRVTSVAYEQSLVDEFGKNYLTTHFSNNHVISLDPKIRSEFERVRKGDTIRFIGYLVSVETEGMQPWTSSVDRTGHKCEIVYIEKFLNLSR